MTTRKEFFKSVMEDTLKNTVQTLLRTKEYSARFLSRKDAGSIDNEIAGISSEIATRLISKLEARGKLEEQSKISQKEFDELFRSTIDEYFGESSEGKTD